MCVFQIFFFFFVREWVGAAVRFGHVDCSGSCRRPIGHPFLRFGPRRESRSGIPVWIWFRFDFRQVLGWISLILQFLGWFVGGFGLFVFVFCFVNFIGCSLEVELVSVHAYESRFLFSPCIAFEPISLSHMQWVKTWFICLILCLVSEKMWGNGKHKKWIY